MQAGIQDEDGAFVWSPGTHLGGDTLKRCTEQKAKYVEAKEEAERRAKEEAGRKCFRGHALMPMSSTKDQGCAYEHREEFDEAGPACVRCERVLAVGEPFVHCSECFTDVCMPCAKDFKAWHGRKETDETEAQFRATQFDESCGSGVDQFSVCMPTKNVPAGGVRISHSYTEANQVEVVAPVESLAFIDVLQSIEEWGYHLIRNQVTRPPELEEDAPAEDLQDVSTAETADREDGMWSSFHARHDILFASLFVTSFTVNGKRFDVEGSPHKTGSWDTTGDGHKDTTDFDVTGTHDRLHLFSLE